MLRNVRSALGSIATKMGIVLLAMAGTTGFAILGALTVFEDVGENLTALVNDRLPEVWVSTTVLAEANALEAAVLSINLANSVDDVSTEFDAAVRALDRLDQLSQVSISAAVAEMSEQLSRVRASVQDMHDASIGKIEAEELLVARMAALSTLADRVNSAVRREVDVTRSAIKIGSSRTLDDIETTLGDLVENDVQLLQLVLKAEAVINLLSGYSLVITQVVDPETLAEFKGAIGEKLPILMATGEDIAAFNSDLVDQGIIDGAIELFGNMSTISQFMAVYQRPEIVAEQKHVEEAFSAIVATLSQSVNDKAKRASQQNESVVKGLLEGVVANNALLQETEITVERFLTLTLRVSEASTVDALTDRQKQLSKIRGKLRLLSLNIGKLEFPEAEGIKADIGALIAFGHPKTGIIQEVERVIDTRSVSVSATRNVKEISVELLNTAYSAGEAIIDDISKDAGALQQGASRGEDSMRTIGALSGLLLVAAILLTIRWILLPIRKITATTRRLAQDDLSEVTGFERSGGEIKSMATALSVFRDSLVDNKKRVQEEAERSLREHRAAEERVAAKQEAERREEALRKKAQDEKSQQDALLAREREEARRLSEAQAKKTAEEQNIIVTNLAHGLKSLASGDLKVQIETTFTEAYEPLRHDFNRTVCRLHEVVAQIAASESSINLSSNEIASRADQLAARTKRTASTLADASSSLGIMTEQVRATSDRAGAALELVQDARDCSDQGRAVVVTTVDAMSDIEDYSKKVSQITEVIDEIAFQTNLLALNAGVEAARAGSAGRGFAVVATEVRELAQRSSHAAGEINGLIADSTKKVEEGARLVTETREALEKIDAAVGHLAVEASEIAEASQDQAKRIGEINGSVSELDELTQQNATMSQETQSANKSMLSESKILATAVAGFSFSNDTKSNPSEAA